MSKLPEKFEAVSVATKANIYFDGKVVSRTVLFKDGTRKTLGLIYAGKYHFGTELAERMELVAGACEILIDGQKAKVAVKAGQAFEVPAHSGYDIEVRQGICEYICSYLA
jgi:uncharacterized protein YaiE (UPF0345 family)